MFLATLIPLTPVQLLGIILVVGLVTFLVPMDARFKQLAYVIVLVLVVIWLLQLFNIL